MFNPENRVQSERLIAEHEMAKMKLKELKTNGVSLIAVDWDGTVYDRNDPDYNSFSKVIQLAHAVTDADIEFAVISARNTTLEFFLRQEIAQYSKEENTSLSIWRSGGNGMNLSKITSSPEGVLVDPIYANFLAQEDINRSMDAYLALRVSPDAESREFFNFFLQQNLPEDLVPKSFFELSKPFRGSVFAEAVKISFVLPTSIEDQEKCFDYLRNSLEPHGLVVNWSKLPFADISRKFNVDGKLLATQQIIQKLKIDKSHVGTFGDAPNGNDAGLLSFPYSFTNYQSLIKKNINEPPFMLDVKKSQTETIHQAIHYLISK
jgi:hydroxymethylpyrimidine pyrophosphatase-like HAD family hydrolase